MKRLLLIGGARPNFMKLAPLIRAFEARAIPYHLLHTGQHYDPMLSDVFFRELSLPEPKFFLNVGSRIRLLQTREIVKGVRSILEEGEYGGVLVVGDVTSTVAATIAAVECGVPVIHVEAGLRSFNWRMAEELNRVFVDHYASMLFTTEPIAKTYLLSEGMYEKNIYETGNVMIDSLHLARPLIDASTILTQLGCVPQTYGVVTLHRPELVDDAVKFSDVFRALQKICETLPLFFPVHPRTRGKLCELSFASTARLTLIDPLGYADMQRLVRDARCVLTDSGGLQEETTALGVPCFTIREDTERPITIEVGTNTLVGCESTKMVDALEQAMKDGFKKGRVPEGWDGHAAERIADILIREL